MTEFSKPKVDFYVTPYSNDNEKHGRCESKRTTHSESSTEVICSNYLFTTKLHVKIHLWQPLAHIKKTICLYLSQWRGLSKSQVPAYFQKLLYKTFQGLDCLFEAEIRFCTLRLTAMHINLRQQLKQYMVNVSLSIQIENCKKCSIIGECLKLIERKKSFFKLPLGTSN